MNGDFLVYLFEKRGNKTMMPTNELISNWALKIVYLLYPEHSKTQFIDQQSLIEYASQLKETLFSILSSSYDTEYTACLTKVERFFEHLPELYRMLNTDITAIYKGDPAAVSKFEVIRTYPGFYAICFYRIAHLLFQLDIPLIPRTLTEYAHSKTGIDIHPAAQIGEYFHIDHGTGIVIGETAIIGKHVKMYQGVTLGALSVKKTLAGKKRHPTVEDSVIIYSGATILGGETIIGHGSVIGGNVWITESVVPFSTVYHSPIITIRNINESI